MLAGARADVGANLARYESESSTLSVLKDNLSAARSRIADVDVAEESANFARQQILVQSGTAMLAQANVLPQSALRLIG
jgi:flagellin